ncbi:PREDICTED: TBC1 domain family member 13-like [Populus euphratica]|uniref:TBC1 domain family member 13-like n=1 Tax=Populus euphratica TaxID=75702 RepID=A0AAJ6Y7S3_POPEU|nr:PREDICTED: TBC1 domain family member 13-like [Populus euphratica]
MVKKKVPDWLNSSLWSTTPSASSSSSSTTTTTTDTNTFDHHSPTTASPPIESPIDPPLPPAAIRDKQQQQPPRHHHNHNHPQKPEVKDKLSKSSIVDDDDNNNIIINNNYSNDNIINNKIIITNDIRNVDVNESSAEDISKQALLLTELSKKVINMGELRRIASQGIPDGAGIRSTVWKLLLGYLAPDRSLWSSELAKKRSQYKHFKEELLMNPSEIARRLEKTTVLNNDNGKSESRCVLSRSEITHDEHPLSLGKSSVWNQFFQDSEIIEQIDRDVKRTHPDLHFFSGDSSLAKSNQEALRNILTVFAKLNPGIRYVQGMNEILAPLFYIFKNDPDEEMAACAEADTFFCFVELLSGFRDHFCQQLDNSVVGIRSTITRLSQLLKEHDEELWRHLEITTTVNPQFYAFRWITLLLTQEFNFADSLHIWDTLLSDPEGPQETLLRVCCAMLILIRRRLLAGDFTSILKLLQNYPPTNISHLLYVANKLRGQPSR